MCKAVFLDLDGTLIGKNNMISEKTKDAITEARHNGHKIFICTGRAVVEVFENVLSIGFDGLICSNGSYIEIKKEVISHKIFEVKMIQALDTFFMKHNIVYNVETNNGVFATQSYLDTFHQIFEKTFTLMESEEEVSKAKENMKKWSSIFSISSNLIRDDVNNVTFIAKQQTDIDKLLETFDSEFEICQNVVPILGEYSGEISLKGTGKGNAIIQVANYLNLDINNTIAIGDGKNDMSMLETVGVGIAMGNASDELKAKADFVTTSIDEEGIYNAFKKLSLI